MGQNADMSDSDYYNSALYLLTKKGDISKGQMYMDLAFQKGFGNTTPIVEIIQINYNAAFDNRDKIGNPNHFYVPLNLFDITFLIFIILMLRLLVLQNKMA